MGLKRKIKRTIEPDNHPIAEVFEEFIAEKEAMGIAASTIRNYNQSTKYFTQHCGLDEANIEDVKQSHIFKWISIMRQNGVTDTSINHYIRDVRTFLYWCMDHQYITEQFKIELVKYQEEAPKHFSDEDLEKLLEKPRKNDSFSEWRTWGVVNWVLGTGNRSSTVVQVRMGDINFKSKEIILSHTKNKKAQMIPLSNSTASAIKEYIKRFRKDVPEDAFLFPNIGEEQLTTNALRHAFAKYCKGRDVEQTNLHGLRHNFAKIWVRNNGNLFKLQQILGHSTLDMTRKYVKLFNEDIKEDFEDFAALDVIKKKKSRTVKIKRSE